VTSDISHATQERCRDWLAAQAAGVTTGICRLVMRGRRVAALMDILITYLTQFSHNDFSADALVWMQICWVKTCSGWSKATTVRECAWIGKEVYNPETGNRVKKNDSDILNDEQLAQEIYTTALQKLPAQ
jgi:hypothetical protein